MARQAKAIILGCGSSGGVPRVDGFWGKCNPDNPKNRRTRCSLFFTVGGQNIIIDTSPDLRLQVHREEIRKVDAVLYTHDHADQAHGIDDIRAFTFLRQGKAIPAYMDQDTANVLNKRFDYIFTPKAGTGYPAIMDLNIVGSSFSLPEIDETIETFPCPHGAITARGFVIGNMAYAPDVHHLEEDTLEFLQKKKLKYFVIDCLRDTPHPTHAHFDIVMEWYDIIQPENMILTNLHLDLDYDELSKRLPNNIKAAYDGIDFDFEI